MNRDFGAFTLEQEQPSIGTRILLRVTDIYVRSEHALQKTAKAIGIRK